MKISDARIGQRVVLVNAPCDTKECIGSTGTITEVTRSLINFDLDAGTYCFQNCRISCNGFSKRFELYIDMNRNGANS